MSIAEQRAQVRTPTDTSSEQRKLIMLGVLAIVILIGLVANPFNTPQQTKPLPEKSSELIEDVPIDGQVIERPPVVFPKAGLETLEDHGVLGAEEPEVLDKLRSWLIDQNHKDLVSAPDADLEQISKNPKAARVSGQLVTVRGKILSLLPYPLIDKPSDLPQVYRGELATDDGKTINFESFDNPHGVRTDELVVLHGVFYSLAAIADPTGKIGPLRPLFLARQLEPDYELYIRRIKDGKLIRDTNYYLLVRKVRGDTDTFRAATTVPAPPMKELATLEQRDAMRGKYIEVTGKLRELKKKVLQAGANRALLNAIWHGTIEDAEGRLFRFDCIKRPTYEPFLLAHQVRVVGAFALRGQWVDEQGKAHTVPYLVTRELELVPGADGKVPFVELPQVLREIKDAPASLNVGYYHVLHKASSMTTEQLAEVATKDKNPLEMMITSADRIKNRGRVMRIAGRLMATQKVRTTSDSQTSNAINPSGRGVVYRSMIATATRTVFTVDLLEPPAKPKAGESGEVVVDAAFYCIRTYRNKKGEPERSPWLVGRELIRRPPIKPTRSMRMFEIGAVALIFAVVLFLVVLARGEQALAGAGRRSLRKARSEKVASALAEVKLSAKTPAISPQQADSAAAQADAAATHADDAALHAGEAAAHASGAAQLAGEAATQAAVAAAHASAAAAAGPGTEEASQAAASAEQAAQEANAQAARASEEAALASQEAAQATKEAAQAHEEASEAHELAQAEKGEQAASPGDPGTAGGTPPADDGAPAADGDAPPAEGGATRSEEGSA